MLLCNVKRSTIVFIEAAERNSRWLYKVTSDFNSLLCVYVIEFLVQEQSCMKKKYVWEDYLMNSYHSGDWKLQVIYKKG